MTNHELFPYLFIFGIFICGCFVGWLLKEQIGGRIARRREVKPGADSSYVWIVNNGETLAFTVEAVAIARDRANRIIGEVDIK